MIRRCSCRMPIKRHGEIHKRLPTAPAAMTRMLRYCSCCYYCDGGTDDADGASDGDGVMVATVMAAVVMAAVVMAAVLMMLMVMMMTVMATMVLTVVMVSV